MQGKMLAGSNHLDPVPLAIKLLPENIFGSLTFRELSAVRLVSKEWYEASFQLWLKRAPLKYLAETGDSSSAAAAVEGLSIFLHQFHNPTRSYTDFESKGIRQYRNLGLIFESFGVVNPLRKAYYDKLLLSQFVINCGAYLRILILQDVMFTEAGSLRDALSCKFTPALEELYVSFNYDIKVGGNGNSTSSSTKTPKNVPLQEPGPSTPFQSRLKLFMVEFRGDGIRNQGHLPVGWVQHHGNLKLQFRGFRGNNDNDVVRIVQGIIREIGLTRKQNSSCFALKTFKMDFIPVGAGTSLVDFFQESKFPLESLNINVGKDNTPGLLNALMRVHSTTLKTFRAHVARFTGDFLEPPPMSHLCQLHVLGTLFPSFKFLKNCPLLKTLIVITASDRIELIEATSADEDMDGVELKFLTQFTYQNRRVVGPADFRRLWGWMPNLTRLEMTLTSATFSMTCGFWPSLEHLVIHERHVEEAAITGRRRGIEMEVQETATTNVPPNITNLKRLRSFTCYFVRRGNSEEARVSKFSLLCSIAGLPSLENFSGSIKIGKDEIEKLRAILQQQVSLQNEYSHQ